jgi:hypothetical protein
MLAQKKVLQMKGNEGAESASRKPVSFSLLLNKNNNNNTDIQ